MYVLQTTPLNTGLTERRHSAHAARPQRDHCALEVPTALPQRPHSALSMAVQTPSCGIVFMHVQNNRRRM